jgi:hypothetical protein
MRTFFLAMAFLSPIAVASAGERTSDAAFLQLNRCAAYGGADGQAVARDVQREAAGRQELIRTRAENEAVQIGHKVRMAKTGAALAAMDAERSEACAAVTNDETSTRAALPGAQHKS